MDQIAAIKAYILQTYPVAGSVHGVHEELIPVMVSLSFTMTITILYLLILNDHGCVDSIISRLERNALRQVHQLYICIGICAFAISNPRRHFRATLHDDGTFLWL